MVSRIDKQAAEAAKNLTTRANARVDKAIKDRTESFVSLQQAAASAFLLAIQFGRWEVFNRLFTGLAGNSRTRIDADALRQKFVWRVVDSFGQGGVPEMSPDGNILGWKTRPVSFVAYRENPPENEKGQHFYFPKVEGKTPADENRRKLIKAGKDAVIAAGEEGLEAIDWLSRAAVIRGDTSYDASNFRKDLARAIRNAIRAMKNDPDTGIAASTIRAIMREASFPKKESAPLMEALDAVANQNKTPSKESAESGDDESTTQAESEKKAA